MEAFLIGLVVVTVGVVFYFISAYNRLVTLKHNVKTAWSNIDVLLQQRHEELPKLVQTCKQHMEFEQETLSRVIQARSQVASARETSNLAELGAAEGAMASSLGSLFALAEDYPELEASNAFQQLQVRISSLENAIADRREYFNDAVNNNNIVVESFPTNLVANQYHFIPRKQFKVEERKRVDVDVEALFD